MEKYKKLFSAQFVILSICSPILFLCFLLLLNEKSIAGQFLARIGLPPFSVASTNVHRINLLIFVPFTVMANTVLLALNFLIIRLFKKAASLDDFFPKAISGWHLIPAGIGGANLLAWSGGMEGNIFGFFIFIPMAFAVLIQALHVLVWNGKMLFDKK